MSPEFPNRDPHEKCVEESLTIRIHNISDWPVLHTFSNGKMVLHLGSDAAWFYDDVLKVWEEKPYTAMQDMKNSRHPYQTLIGVAAFSYLHNRMGP